MWLWAGFIWLRNRSSTEHVSSSMNISHKSTTWTQCSNIYITNSKPKSNMTDNVRITQLRRVRVTTVAVLKQYEILRVCVCILASVIWHASRFVSAPYYIGICGLSGSTLLCHIISQTGRFSGKATEHKTCFDFTYNKCVNYFSF